jgi:hypothetical protein
MVFDKMPLDLFGNKKKIKDQWEVQNYVREATHPGDKKFME